MSIKYNLSIIALCTTLGITFVTIAGYRQGVLSPNPTTVMSNDSAQLKSLQYAEGLLSSNYGQSYGMNWSYDLSLKSNEVTATITYTPLSASSLSFHDMKRQLLYICECISSNTPCKTIEGTICGTDPAHSLYSFTYKHQLLHIH